MVNLPNLFMRLNELCVYAKVQRTLIVLCDVRSWSRVKMSSCKTLTFIVYCDHLFIQTLQHLLFNQKNYCAIVVCLVLLFMHSLSKRTNMAMSALRRRIV
ncbi:unnamed protein product [Clavelina lepadiformis]|uniref:Uncharacterized protein n=1 Tax=Clavelina lepadiformis TaxID=159417 RepID=A0ABP0G377_CLALP